MALFPHTHAARFRPEALFRPRAVAVVGAQTRAGGQVLANLLAGGFGGAVLPVAPGRAAVGGVFAWPDIASLPVAPDLAILCDDALPAAPVFTALAARGTFAAVAVALSEGIAEAARASGVRALGPGSFGIAIPALGLNASRAHLRPRPGRVALVSQSAALCRAVLDWAEPNGVGFSAVVGIGGNADLGFAMVLDWLARDPGTGAILLDIRRIKDRRAFLSAARAAARLRPTVAIRAGGRLAEPSGAGDAVFAAALRRCGILAVETLEDLFAAAGTLTRARPLRGEGLAIATNAVGPAQMAADAALRGGLALARLAAGTRGAIAACRPGALTPPPGPDSGGHADETVYVGPDDAGGLAETAALLAGAREVGGVLAVHAPAGEQDAAAVAALAEAARAASVPLLVAVLGETTGAAHRAMLAAAGVPVFATPEQAVRGFGHLVQDRRARAAARELPPSDVLEIAPDRAAVERLFAAARAAGRATLTQDEALAVLAAYGVGVVPTHRAADAAEAEAAAAALGWPVVLKRRRSSRPDPAARGGLALDLAGAEEVRAAAVTLARAAPVPEGFLVQRQMGRARELLVCVAEDETFGPTIGFGPGGTAAAYLHDLARDLPPLNLPLAHALIARTRVAATLGPLHDQPAADEAAVADLLVRVSQLVVDFPAIAALEINPAFAFGQGVVVADAWIALRPPGTAPGRLAIPPYPAGLAEHFAARGERFLVRPIRPEDADAHRAFFARLSPEDVRYRFFSALRELSPEQMARLTQIDYEREMAFIAVREAPGGGGGGETVGVARLMHDFDAAEGEFAVVVQPDAKGRGLAGHLMARLEAWGRTAGVRTMVGQVLADNAPMLGFMRSLGFTIRRLPDEEGLMEARKDL